MTAARVINAEVVRAALVARAGKVAVALLGEPNRAMSSRRELRFGKHGSMAVVVAGPKGGLWRDHETGEGGDLFDLIARLRGGGFKDALEYATDLVGTGTMPSAPPRQARPEPDQDDATRTRRALTWWREADPVAGTLAERYLVSRNVWGVIPDNREVLRFHPRCPYADAHHPCLLALMRDIATDEPRAIQRTALSPAAEKIGRMTFGPKAGTAIKLDEDVTLGLAVGEGLETTLSGMSRGFQPAWAVGDAGELSAFPVLGGVETLTILVDHDEAGEWAAIRCSARWTTAGREVIRVTPQAPGADINDVLAKGRTT
jgi:putative DNA primase/helicase